MGGGGSLSQRWGFKIKICEPLPLETLEIKRRICEKVLIDSNNKNLSAGTIVGYREII